MACTYGATTDDQCDILESLAGTTGQIAKTFLYLICLLREKLPFLEI